jgi:hypothetical protein
VDSLQFPVSKQVAGEATRPFAFWPDFLLRDHPA